MFGMIRILFWAAASGIALWLLKKKNSVTRKKVIVIFGIASLLCSLSGLFPVENYIYTFSSPEKAYEYMHFQKADIVVDGKNSSLVIAKNSESSHTHKIFPKVQNGWKLASGADTKLKERALQKNVSINLYEHKNSGDYYITVLTLDDNKPEIVDSCGSTFVTVDKEQTATNTALYFAYVSQYDQDYRIEINGQTFTLGQNDSSVS